MIAMNDIGIEIVAIPIRIIIAVSVIVLIKIINWLTNFVSIIILVDINFAGIIILICLCILCMIIEIVLILILIDIIVGISIEIMIFEIIAIITTDLIDIVIVESITREVVLLFIQITLWNLVEIIEIILSANRGNRILQLLVSGRCSCWLRIVQIQWDKRWCRCRWCCRTEIVIVVLWLELLLQR